MSSLLMKISEIKKNLMDINIKAINKSKAKPIKINFRNQEDINIVKDYNYHVKLMKRIKKYMDLNQGCKIILRMTKNRFENIICIVIKIDKDKIDIGIPIEIRLIAGNDCNANMDCTYYEKHSGGSLYINDFRSARPNQGYGGIILKNLDNIIDLVNENLQCYDREYIKIVEGKLIANINIISEDDLKDMYIRYGFEIDDKNNMKKSLKSSNK